MPNGSLQRAYVSGLCRLSTAEYICKELNRIPGFIAYWHRNYGDDCAIRELWVTYDQGKPFSQLISETDVLDGIGRWNPQLAAGLKGDPEIVSLTCMQATIGNDLVPIISGLLDRRYASSTKTPPTSPSSAAAIPFPVADVKSQNRLSPSFTTLDAGGEYGGEYGGGVPPPPAVTYGRGQGFPWQFGDELGDGGMFRRCEAAYGRGACEKWGTVVYPRCRHGYYPLGCCMCARRGGRDGGGSKETKSKSKKSKSKRS
jgi:hypothetical protein